MKNELFTPFAPECAMGKSLLSDSARGIYAASTCDVPGRVHESDALHRAEAEAA